MLQTVFHFFMQYRRVIYLFFSIAGLIIYLVARYLRKQERKNPGSVADWESKAFALYVVALIVWIGVIVAFCFDGYYDRFFGWILELVK